MRHDRNTSAPLQERKKTLKAVLIMAALAITSTASAMSNDELVHCAHIALKFNQSPTSPSVRELDTLRICVTEIMAQKIQEPKDDAIDRAITKNFGKEGDK